MQSTWLDKCVTLLGVPGVLVLVTIVLAAIIIALYLILQFGEVSLKALASFVIRVLNVIRTEPGNSHPAIRIEFSLHIILCVAFLLSFGGVAIHELVPWVRPRVENCMLVVGVSSLTIIVLLGWESMRLSLRLPKE